MRIFAVSDVHIDYPDNLKWFESLSEVDYTEDVLLLAGDVTHNFENLKAALKQLKDKFLEVLFVPGNHDLWIDQVDQENSLNKFNQIS